MKAKLPAAFLLFLPLALALGTSPDFLSTHTSLDAEASTISPQVYGASTLFTCKYSDGNGEAVLNSTCQVVVDGRLSKAVPNGVSHLYGELLSVGQHSWYCSCSAAGYEPKESDPRGITILPPQSTESLKLEASTALRDAEQVLADARQSGADTGTAEAELAQAKAAFEKGDYKLANSLISNSIFGNTFNARDRITDLGLLLVPTLFFGVLIVAILFVLLRK